MTTPLIYHLLPHYIRPLLLSACPLSIYTYKTITVTDQNKRIKQETKRVLKSQVTSQEPKKTKAIVKLSKNIEKPLHRPTLHSFLIERFCHSQEISRKSQETGQELVPKNNRIPKSICKHLVIFCSICAMFYLLSLTDL